MTAEGDASTFTPVFLGANQPAARFYDGGAKISRFRSTEASAPFTPEDWVASTTSLFGEHDLGLTVLPNGQLLRDAISTNPVAWLGDEHVRSYGPDSMLLVKLLDAGERLPVHIHPGGVFARAHLGARHGKAEAWHILDAGEIHLGFRRSVRPDEIRDWVDRQDVAAMLDAMHRVQVNVGDFIFVPAGVPHAIGKGVFLVEVQEPADMSILLEWDGYDLDGPRDGHLGLGFDRALEAVAAEAFTMGEINQLVTRADAGNTLPASADSYFRAETLRVEQPQRVDAGFGILISLEGAGTITTATGFHAPIARGDTVVIPHGCGAVTLSGASTILHCRPPAPR
ncbi:class I mannose-6-phosphate isomerase [Paramicrobacterium fandaimingii]|uniref:class I mannose-6-phosphate isomerase n=1 Tax=Paramicrobacterium fandaimingii TaxID=2708079 RepID=UPI00141FC725|nr:class I mannose-6-phosphate isomerase [Microbacterium fandaimingii]